MFAIGVGLTVMGLTGSPEAGLCVVILCGAAAAIAAHVRPCRRVRRSVTLLVLGELFLAGCFGSYPGGAIDPLRVTALLLAGALGGILVTGAPLPDAYLPLRGRWLRRLLTVGALFGMILGGPWIDLWGLWLAQRLTVWPLAPGVAVAAWLLWITGRTLADRSTTRPRAAAGCASVTQGEGGVRILCQYSSGRTISIRDDLKSSVFRVTMISTFASSAAAWVTPSSKSLNELASAARMTASVTGATRNVFRRSNSAERVSLDPSCFRMR
jgi:hypothetical protein